MKEGRRLDDLEMKWCGLIYERTRTKNNQGVGLVVVCVQSTVMDDVEEQITITCTTRGVYFPPLSGWSSFGTPRELGSGILCVWGTKRSAYLST